ncbi:hypothetical protein [Butyrivibrio sp. AE3004]|uniref:hypothetical protein n=1 Tax=Butyrivibrio sp. AE3004 TaxID=1506994 RepID=UPI00049414F2|nr:hypothetical protein [Butyrivibrio sp. AE3004]
MQIEIGILHKGDSVLNVWDNNIAVRRKNEDVEIFHYDIDDEGLPRLSNNSILITQGNGVIKTKSEDGSVEMGTF